MNFLVYINYFCIKRDQTTSPVWELVITQMMHGPCGSLNPNSLCMIDGKCDKDFPKDFFNETIVEDIDGYPKYCC